MTCIKCQHGKASRFGTYGKAKIQRYRCKECRATFIEPTPKPLGSHYTDIETAVKVPRRIRRQLHLGRVRPRH